MGLNHIFLGHPVGFGGQNWKWSLKNILGKMKWFLDQFHNPHLIDLFTSPIDGWWNSDFEFRISQFIFEMWMASEACLLKGSEYEANICIWFSIMFCVLMVVHERLIIWLFRLACVKPIIFQIPCIQILTGFILVFCITILVLTLILVN